MRSMRDELNLPVFPPFHVSSAPPVITGCNGPLLLPRSLVGSPALPQLLVNVTASVKTKEMHAAFYYLSLGSLSLLPLLSFLSPSPAVHMSSLWHIVWFDWSYTIKALVSLFLVPRRYTLQFGDLSVSIIWARFQRAIKPRWFTRWYETGRKTDLWTGAYRWCEELSSKRLQKVSFHPQRWRERDTDGRRNQPGKYSHEYGCVQSFSDGTRCQPPFIKRQRNEQPFCVIPYYFQLFQGTAFPKAAGDNDNVGKPCNRIRLHAAQRCQSVCRSR